MSEKTKQWIMISSIAGSVLIAGGIALFLYLTSVSKETASNLSNQTEGEAVQSTEEFVADSEDVDQEQAEDTVVDVSGSEIYEVTRKVVETEMETLLHGIDVSQHQGNINWDEVAAEGIDFAIIRVGNRNVVSGEIEEDITARYNLQEATSRGILVGAYFFSAATTEDEAIDEANFVTDIIDGYPITYPVAYNCELYEEEDSRHFTLSVEDRSEIADVFLSEIEHQGYTGMFYASQSELEGNAKWNTDLLEAKYRIWVAQYKEISEIDLESDTSDYGEDHELWQYTANGLINGISMPVDMNVSYIGYREVPVAKSPESAVHQEANLEVGVHIEKVDDSVTAKELVNVRSSMDQADDSNIIGELQNGEIVTRTGIGVNGWSRIEYNGEIYKRERTSDGERTHESSRYAKCGGAFADYCFIEKWRGGDTNRCGK